MNLRFGMRMLAVTGFAAVLVGGSALTSYAQQPPAQQISEADTAIGAVHLRRDNDIHRRSNATRPHPELRVVSSVE